MRFSKWHGLGNDYLLVERAELAFPLTPERVQKLCDYHFGVGSDGIVEVTAANGDRAEVVIWNPDGSRAELSGNGTRIAAAWLAARSRAERVEVVVGERTVVARMLGDGTVEQEMGEVVVGQAETVDGLSVRPVSVGNPHAVVLGDPDTITEIGPFLEVHARWAKELIVGYARLEGRVVGIVANQPKFKGGVLFVDDEDEEGEGDFFADEKTRQVHLSDSDEPSDTSIEGPICGSAQPSQQAGPGVMDP
jgi:diaminopimelate epimerase